MQRHTTARPTPGNDGHPLLGRRIPDLGLHTAGGKTPISNYLNDDVRVGLASRDKDTLK